MAEGESQFTVNVETKGIESVKQLQDYVTHIKEDIEWINKNGLDLKAPSGYGPSSLGAQPSPAGGGPSSSTIQNLQVQYQRAFLTKYIPEFLKYTKDFKSLSFELTSGARGISALGRAALGLGGAGVAGGALAAFYGLARDAASRGRFAAGIGGNVGSATASDVYLQRFVDDPKAGLSAAARARYDVTSRAFLAPTISGINTDQDPAKVLGQLAVKWSEISKKWDKITALTMANTMGFSEYFNQADLIRLRETDAREVEAQNKLIEANKEQYDLTKEQAKAYQDLIQKTTGAGYALETYFEKKLIDGAPELEKFIDDVVNIGKEFADLTAGLIHYGSVTADVLNKLANPPPPSTVEGAPLNERDKPFSVPVPEWLKPIPITPEMQIPDYTGPGQTPKPERHSELLGKRHASGGEAFDFNFDTGEKLNDNVKDTSKSFSAFNQELIASSNIFVDLNRNAKDIASGKYLTDREQALGLSDGGGGVGSGSIGGAPVSIRERGTRGGGAAGGGGPTLPDVSGTEVTKPGEKGKYRPVYKLGDKDLSDAVVNTIAGEAKAGNTAGVDAVIDNMFNRLGTKTYGPSGNLEEVARAPGQYAGYRKASAKEAEEIRERIKLIASGSLPDITGGSNEYRASWYHGPWAQKHPEGKNIGGNVFAYNPKGGKSPYAAFDKPGDGEAAELPDLKATGFGSEVGKDLGLRADNPEDRAKINAYMKEAGIPVNSANIAWCAAWLNAQLAHEGIKGTGALNVDSFRKWGKSEGAAQAHKGDVMIVAGGAHIGRFTGDIDPKTGRYGFYSGNAGAAGEPTPPPGRSQWGQVKEQWYDPRGVEFRAPSETEMALRKAVPRKEASTDTEKAAPSGTSGHEKKPITHIGDLSMFQHNSGMNIKVSNPAGADVNIQTAMLGLSAGSFIT